MVPTRPRSAARFVVGSALVAVVAGCSGGTLLRPPAQRPWETFPNGGRLVEARDVLGSCHAADMIAGSQVEPFLAVSPADPAFLVGVWQQDRFSTEGAFGIAVAASRDSGRTWSTSRLPYLSTCGGGSYFSLSDPQVGIDPSGRIYVSTIAFGEPGQAVLVSSSSDFGRSWSRPAVVRRVDDGSAILDKPALLVDRYRPDTAYLVWVEYPRAAGESLSSLRVDTAFISRSQDGGRTWSTPARLYGSNTENQNHVLLQLADRTLVDVFAEGYRLSMPALTEEIRVIRSSDGGNSWSLPETVARFPYSVATLGPHPIRASGQDVSAFAEKNSVYVSWEYNAPDHSQIGVVYSTDEGRTWITPADPVDGPSIAFLPDIAVDARGGVALTWYQTISSAGDPTTVEFGELDPGRARWSIKALIGPFSLDNATPSPEGYFLGDYESLTPSPCGFRLFDSIATRNGSRITTAAVCPKSP